MDSHSFLQGNLLSPVVEPGSPALLADSLLSEPPGKPIFPYYFFNICRFYSDISFIPNTCNLCLSFLLPSFPCLAWLEFFQFCRFHFSRVSFGANFFPPTFLFVLI